MNCFDSSSKNISKPKNRSQKSMKIVINSIETNSKFYYEFERTFRLWITVACPLNMRYSESDNILNESSHGSCSPFWISWKQTKERRWLIKVAFLSSYSNGLLMPSEKWEKTSFLFVYRKLSMQFPLRINLSFSFGVSFSAWSVCVSVFEWAICWYWCRVH